MEIRYYEQPQMLLETIELLYAFVNRIPPVEVAGHGLYCIPAESLQQIMDTCCAEIDRNDTILRFFFEKESLNDDSDNETCTHIWNRHASTGNRSEINIFALLMRDHTDLG